MTNKLFRKPPILKNNNLTRKKIIFFNHFKALEIFLKAYKKETNI